jgi:hypothetical protein
MHKRERVVVLLVTRSDLTATQIAREAQCTVSYVYKIKASRKQPELTRLQLILLSSLVSIFVYFFFVFLLSLVKEF